MGIKAVSVTSLAEVWIEIDKLRRHFVQCVVTSLAEVWIEIRCPARLLWPV